MLDLFATLVMLFVIGWSSYALILSRSLLPGQTRTFKLFGHEILVISAGTIDVSHQLEAGDTEADEEEEEEPDERTLEERLRDAGFELIEPRVAPDLEDIGGVFFDTDVDEDDCPENHDTLHPFGEVIGDEAPDAGAPPTRALRNRYGSACDTCGYLAVTETFAPRGRFGPLVENGTDLFDLLERFEKEKEAAELAGDDEKLAARERELEAELNAVRTLRHARAIDRATVDPFRGAVTPAVDLGKKDS